MSFSPRSFGQDVIRPSHLNLWNLLRGPLSLALAAFLFFAPLTFMVSGQEASPSEPTGKGQNRENFIIYADESGEVVCREATLDEAREMNKINPRGLTQINHLGNDSAKTDTAQTGDNVFPNLTIILRATAQLDGNTQAKAAFLRAAAAWESVIKSPITIYLDADFGSTNFGAPWGSGTLGSTSSPNVPGGALYSAVRSNLITGASNASESSIYPTLPVGTIPTDVGNASSMSISSSIGRAIGLLPPTAQSTDPAARIGFNSAFTYDFDPTDGISGGTDFTAVATHEIGHALGFTSRAGSSTNSTPAMLDLFRFRTGTTAGTFSTAQRILTVGGSPDPLQFYFFPDGPELGLSNGGPSGSSDNGADGEQSSHWKRSSLNGNVVIGIMDPRIPSNTPRNITANDLRAFNSFGYNFENNNPPPPLPPPPPVPANNNFANAQILQVAGCAGSATGTNVGADKETGEPSHSPDNNAGGSSVWYQWTAPATGSVTFTTAGSSYDTLLAVYTGNTVNALSSLGKNDDVDIGVVLSSTVTFSAVAGTTYKIAVDGWGGDTGTIVLNWTQGSCNSSMTAQLSSGTYQVAENAVTATITVNRSNTASAATVSYATNDTAGLQNCTVHNGNASERCDYQTTVGTLQFAAGESSKTFAIPIIDDGHNEGGETFSVSLKTSTGMILAAPVSAVITIVDNATPTVNPIDDPAFFITQQYLDFLGRLPDSTGFNNWMATLTGCPNGGFGEPPTSNCDRLHVAAGFFQSDEFLNRGYFAFRFYMVAFNQRPTYAQFMPDMAQVGGPKSPAEEEAAKVAFADAFVQRPEFVTRYSGLSGQALAEALLQTAGLPAGSYNAGGQSNGQILRGIAETSAAFNKFLTEGTVSILYFGFQRRDPDSIGYQNNVDTLNANSNNLRHMIFIFIYSTEYRQRFGQ